MDDRSVDVSNPGDTIVVGIVVVDDVIAVTLLFKLLSPRGRGCGGEYPFAGIVAVSS